MSKPVRSERLTKVVNELATRGSDGYAEALENIVNKVADENFVQNDDSTEAFFSGVALGAKAGRRKLWYVQDEGLISFFIAPSEAALMAKVNRVVEPELGPGWEEIIVGGGGGGKRRRAPASGGGGSDRVKRIRSLARGA